MKMTKVKLQSIRIRFEKINKIEKTGGSIDKAKEIVYLWMITELIQNMEGSSYFVKPV